MTLDEGKNVISHLFEPGLSRLGFKNVQGLFFVRDMHDVLEILTFTGRVADGTYYFTVGVGLRFPEIEQILESGSQQRYFPTIGKPIHLLRDDRHFSEWSMGEGVNVESVRESVMSDIETLALPFLNDFSSLVRVRENLESVTPRDWFTLDPEQRIATLAAIDVSRGEKTRALNRIERALDQLGDKPPKKRRLLERLRERLSQL